MEWLLYLSSEPVRFRQLRMAVNIQSATPQYETNPLNETPERHRSGKTILDSIKYADFNFPTASRTYATAPGSLPADSNTT